MFYSQLLPKIRINIVFMFFLTFFSLVIFKLFYWQVVKGEDLTTSANSQYDRSESIEAIRGSILSHDNSWLVSRVEAYRVFASPKEIEEDFHLISTKIAPLLIKDDMVELEKKHQEELKRNEIALELLSPTPILGIAQTTIDNEKVDELDDVKEKMLEDEIERVEKLLSKDELVWVSIKSKISKETKEEISNLNVKGIGFEPVEDRIYPEGSMAAHLLGFVGKNESDLSIGYFGLEGEYDQILSGKPGFLERESDLRGVPMFSGKSKEVSAINGYDLVTNIDKAIQIALEDNLKAGIERYGALAGTGIIMDPKTGGILAMSSYPNYEPNKYSNFSNEDFLNPAVSTSFEPGSIFKVLVMAAGLDSKEVKIDTKCDICGAPVKVDKYFIKTWNNEYNKDATMLDVIVHSDNTGMVFVANKLGKKRMYDYLSKFGIGKVTGIDLQGESSPKIRAESDWSIVDLATASFGQGIAVTPIQMVRAVGAIANDGVIMTPRVVKKVRGDGFEKEIATSSGQRVISKEAARDITAMMTEAAKNGESKWTYRAGFGVAGKTGTAQIPIAGHYDAEKTIASFVGFAPFDDPKFVMLIILREPQSSPWASETAAPLWYDIAEELFLYFGIQPK